MCLGCLLISCAVSAQTCACQAIALRVFDQAHTSHPDLLSRGLRCQLGSQASAQRRRPKKKPVTCSRGAHARTHTHTHRTLLNGTYAPRICAQPCVCVCTCAAHSCYWFRSSRRIRISVSVCACVYVPIFDIQRH